MHNKTAHLLINIKIIIFRAMGIKINQILGFSGQMRDLLMSFFFYYYSESLFLLEKKAAADERCDKYERPRILKPRVFFYFIICRGLMLVLIIIIIYLNCFFYLFIFIVIFFLYVRGVKLQYTVGAKL